MSVTSLFAKSRFSSHYTGCIGSRFVVVYVQCKTMTSSCEILYMGPLKKTWNNMLILQYEFCGAIHVFVCLHILGDRLCAFISCLNAFLLTEGFGK